MMIVQFLNRAAAGIVTAALTGSLSGVLISLYTFGLGGPTGAGADLFGGSVWIIAMLTLFGAIFGAPFGILVMCLSRAKAAPWRSLPTLLIGTTIGFVALGLPWALLPGTTVNSIILNVMSVAGPTIGGIVATKFIPGPDVSNNRSRRVRQV